jgi:hypothetical protein
MRNCLCPSRRNALLLFAVMLLLRQVDARLGESRRLQQETQSPSPPPTTNAPFAAPPDEASLPPTDAPVVATTAPSSSPNTGQAGVPPYATTPCIINLLGTYGSVTSGGTEFVLSYDYEMEFKTTTQNAIPITLIPALDVAFGRALLSTLFASQCATNNGSGSTDLATGMSTMPQDAIVSGRLCKNQNETENLCLVYAGRITVFYNTATVTNTTVLKETLLGVLEAGMNNGGFLHAHDGLERIGYIGEDEEDAENAKEFYEEWLEWIRDLIESEDKTQLFIVAGGVVVAVLGFCLCIILLRR